MKNTLPIKEQRPKHPLNQGNKTNVLIPSFMLLFFLLVSNLVFSQTQRYAANASPILTPPYSLFIEDYTDPGKEQLKANIVFNDFNEATWNFKLRLTIESTDIQIRTIEGYTPPRPIVVQPGVLTQLSTEEWVNYLDFNNVTISGAGTASFRNSGRLPEGMYSFCVEVLDYTTGEPLSRESCSNAWLQLNDPPRIISPSCGTVVDPQLAAFPIQWQLFNTQSPNATMGTEYQLTLWEITDPTADPMVAVPNAQALQVFQSDFQMATSFNYGPAEPLLELGKRYVYRIQARAADGRDSFKNQGYSEFFHFSFGWPAGGNIKLSWPENDEGFNSLEIPYVSWKRPNNAASNQRVSYQLEVMRMLEGQTIEEAYRANDPWFARQLPEVVSTIGGSSVLPQDMGKSEQYAWKVTAFTGEQQIAKSDIQSFYGPSLVEAFYAGNHKVMVDYIKGKDVTNISGGGRVRLSATLDDWTNLEFENISLVDNGGFWVMDGGEIIITQEKERVRTLTPVAKDNGAASFTISKYRLDKDGLFAWGKVTWDLPHATTSTQKAVVESVEQWANFNVFRINTVIPLPENANRFDLLEPFGFTLDLRKSSLIYINQERYRMELNGEVLIPDHVKRFGSSRSGFVFNNAEDLFYLSATEASFANALQPLANTQYWLYPTAYEIDLSEKQSPGIHAATPNWKGIDIKTYKLTFEKSPDHKGQLSFSAPFEQTYEQSGNQRYTYVNSGGLSMKLDASYPDLEDELRFQTFPSNPRTLKLEISDNKVSEQSKFTGDFLIPFVSLTKRFGYEIPITNIGFEKGFLTDLEGVAFTHNPGLKEQEIHVKVQRAVLSGNEKITMTLDMDWPGMGVQLTSLRDFKVWGDHSIGFRTKNGTVALEKRENARMSSQKYPVTIDIIGAGGYKGQYMIATTADIVLGEDVSGPDQAPTVNVYSSVANPYVANDQEGSIGDLPEDGPTIEEATAQIKDEIASYEKSLLSKLSEDRDAIKAQAIAYQQGLGGSTAYLPEDMINNVSADEVPAQEQDELYEMIEAFTTVLATHYAQPLTALTENIRSDMRRVVSSAVNEAGNKMDQGIDALVDPIVQALSNSLQNDQIDVSSIITELGQIAKTSLKEEVRSSLQQSVHVNITQPVEYLLTDQVTARVQNYLITNGTDVFYQTLRGDNGGQALADMVTGIPGLAGEILGDAAEMIRPDAIQSTVASLIDDFIKGVDSQSIIDEIEGKAGEMILAELGRFATDKIADVASNILGEQSLPGWAGEENPVDFAAMGSKLADGDYAGALKEALPIDALPLKMRSPIVDLDGRVYYTPNDPVYGNVWVGDITMNVKVPKPFGLSALYINGRKEGNSYWFVEIRGNEEEPESDPQKKAAKGGYKLGDPIPKKARALKNPVNMGIANLVGVSGRLYSGMSESPDGGIVPDPSLKLGAYMNVVFFDKKNDGENMRLAVEGEINTKTNGDYTLKFNGDLQLQSEAPSVTEIDELAAVQGIIEISYNSAERHFLGYARVELNKPGSICANGSLLVDSKPGQWRVALGSREDRLNFVPGCTGWSPTGWLDVNQNEAELGLGAQFSVTAETPTLVVFPFKVNFAVEAGIAFGIVAAIQYRPTFQLLRAGVWADLWASVIMNYKKPLGKWKQRTLVEIMFSGNLTLYFVPKPTILEGDVKGRVKILFFNAKVNAHLRKEI